MMSSNSNLLFRFKLFTVANDRCAMKVNTDGVLLGAWQQGNTARYILDIGTGTGVLTLMMAQKNRDATIDAIDIDDEAYLQAQQNFMNSPWANRLNAFHTSLQNFNADTKYDVIISNPPYFIDDFTSSNQQRNLARHSIALSYDDLIEGIERLLCDTGIVWVVIPIFNVDLFNRIAAKKRLFITQRTDVISVNGKPPYLALLKLQRIERPYIIDYLEIQNVDGSFSQQYIHLTKDFYLKF